MKNNKGITLIALVITIIVMLILVGVTINISTNKGGIFDSAKNAANKTTYDAEKEEILNYMYGDQEIYNARTGELNLEKLREKLEKENWQSGTISSGILAIKKTEKGEIHTITSDGKIDEENKETAYIEFKDSIATGNFMLNSNINEILALNLEDKTFSFNYYMENGWRTSQNKAQVTDKLNIEISTDELYKIIFLDINGDCYSFLIEDNNSYDGEDLEPGWYIPGEEIDNGEVCYVPLTKLEQIPEIESMTCYIVPNNSITPTAENAITEETAGILNQYLAKLFVKK